MHEVEVEVVGAKILQGGIERFLDVIGVVGVVPELGGDEELFARDAGFFDGIAYGGLGAIDACGIDMAITRFERNRDCSIFRVSIPSRHNKVDVAYGS